MTQFEKKSFSVYMAQAPRLSARGRASALASVFVDCPECGKRQLLNPDKIGTARCVECRHLFPRVQL